MNQNDTSDLPWPWGQKCCRLSGTGNSQNEIHKSQNETHNLNSHRFETNDTPIGAGNVRRLERALHKMKCTVHKMEQATTLNTKQACYTSNEIRDSQSRL